MNFKIFIKYLLLSGIIFSSNPLFSQASIARKWNEILLDAIRNDLARPTVHARNLFHISGAMYDSWATFDEQARTYLLGNEVHGFTSQFNGFSSKEDASSLKEKALSYAAYRLIKYRFANSPGETETFEIADQLFMELGYDPAFTSTDYSFGSAAALGNYIAEQYIAYGLLDGANEENGYQNQSYEPVNDSLDAGSPGNPNITDPNKWQPLAFLEFEFEDQGGNLIDAITPDFLGPEWGTVSPFSLKEEELSIYNKDGFDYYVYHDPGPPPYLDPENGLGFSDLYKWGFSLVAIWSGHLDETDDVLIDISPGSIGNIDLADFPRSFTDYHKFYKYLSGGDISKGHETNPFTGMAYPSQIVALGDYGRVLAEFWADGPDSETPPGHWFTLLNYVSDHPKFEKRFMGTGELMDDLEWDVKSYFILGGAMHDAAVTAWGIKGYYDYIRPISALRYMADKGQSSDESKPNYNIAGIPLVDGHIELVLSGDPLAGEEDEHLHKIKFRAWKGPDYIVDPDNDVAGVDWILAENWWPYQRPSFVTPPFAGYVSGHSTYSRAAAEVLTALTGDPFFPGGLGEFEAPMNEFLVFEDGPSEDIILQWATYRDASDQCSLSRIWGGIHPPADDLPGRIIGEKIGIEAFEYAASYFSSMVTSTKAPSIAPQVYPNPASNQVTFLLPEGMRNYAIKIYDLNGNMLVDIQQRATNHLKLDISELASGMYVVSISNNEWTATQRLYIK